MSITLLFFRNPGLTHYIPIKPVFTTKKVKIEHHFDNGTIESYLEVLFKIATILDVISLIML